MRSISKFAKYDEKVDKELELHPVKTPIFPDENKEASAWDNRHECCSVCKLYVGDRPMMEEHIRQKHPEELICKICNEVQSTVEHLKKHEAQHKSGYLAKKAAFVPYVKVRLDNGKVVRRQRCPTCNKLVSRLKRHIVVEHTKDYKFSCSECDRKFPLEEDLTKHIKIQHLNDFPFLCVECGKGFKCKTLLTTHERRHRGEKFVFCDICGTGFYSKSVLVVHLVDRHINTAREHPCDVCGKMFKKRAAVRHHRIRHFEENKRFECDFCSERFFKKCLLLYHVKIAHTLERPYECDICGKGFILRSLMTQHAIRHMDIKMHQCHLCPNSYRWPRNLSRHLIAVHSNQLAKFMCDLCGEEFLTELSMMNHKIKKHPTPNQFLVDPEDMQESNNAGNELYLTSLKT